MISAASGNPLVSEKAEIPDAQPSSEVVLHVCWLQILMLHTDFLPLPRGSSGVWGGTRHLLASVNLSGRASFRTCDPDCAVPNEALTCSVKVAGADFGVAPAPAGLGYAY